MNQTEKIRPHNDQQKTENYGAHSGVRNGSSEYHDGENVTHYLGNGELLLGKQEATLKEAGKVALGNQ